MAGIVTERDLSKLALYTAYISGITGGGSRKCRRHNPSMGLVDMPQCNPLGKMFSFSLAFAPLRRPSLIYSPTSSAEPMLWRDLALMTLLKSKTGRSGTGSSMIWIICAVNKYHPITSHAKKQAPVAWIFQVAFGFLVPV